VKGNWTSEFEDIGGERKYTEESASVWLNEFEDFQISIVHSDHANNLVKNFTISYGSSRDFRKLSQHFSVSATDLDG
jgi:hypothetical protein